MSRLRHAFTRDLGRKALALALAIFIWWRVSAAIEEDMERTVYVVDASASIAADGSAAIQETRPGQIRVVVPEGWLLVEPKFGTELPLHLHGARVDVEEFMAEGAIAEFAPSRPAVGPDEQTFSIVQDLADINWRRGAQARLLLAGADNPEVAFEFTRAGTVTAQILPSEIVLRGSLPEGFVVAKDEISLSPDQVTVTGPVDQLPTPLADGSVKLGSLLEAVTLAPGTKTGFETQLRLSESAVNAGLRMQPEFLTLRVPVFAETLAPFRILPKPEDIKLIGEAPEGQWAVDRYKGSSFVVSYRHNPDILELPTPSELFRSESVSGPPGMITFFVDLSALPPGAEDLHELPIEWMLRGAGQFADRSQYIALRDALEILPDTDDYASLVVSLDKLEQE